MPSYIYLLLLVPLMWSLPVWGAWTAQSWTAYAVLGAILLSTLAVQRALAQVPDGQIAKSILKRWRFYFLGSLVPAVVFAVIQGSFDFGAPDLSLATVDRLNSLHTAGSSLLRLLRYTNFGLLAVALGLILSSMGAADRLLKLTNLSRVRDIFVSLTAALTFLGLFTVVGFVEQRAFQAKVSSIESTLEEMQSKAEELRVLVGWRVVDEMTFAILRSTDAQNIIRSQDELTNAITSALPREIEINPDPPGMSPDKDGQASDDEEAPHDRHAIGGGPLNGGRWPPGGGPPPGGGWPPGSGPPPSSAPASALVSSDGRVVTTFFASELGPLAYARALPLPTISVNAQLWAAALTSRAAISPLELSRSLPSDTTIVALDEALHAEREAARKRAESEKELSKENREAAAVIRAVVQASVDPLLQEQVSVALHSSAADPIAMLGTALFDLFFVKPVGTLATDPIAARLVRVINSTWRVEATTGSLAASSTGVPEAESVVAKVASDLPPGTWRDLVAPTEAMLEQGREQRQEIFLTLIHEMFSRAGTQEPTLASLLDATAARFESEFRDMAVDRRWEVVSENVDLTDVTFLDAIKVARRAEEQLLGTDYIDRQYKLLEKSREVQANFEDDPSGGGNMPQTRPGLEDDSPFSGYPRPGQFPTKICRQVCTGGRTVCTPGPPSYRPGPRGTITVGPGQMNCVYEPLKCSLQCN
jgi:hypothetical protein